MPPARTTRRRFAALSASAAGLVLAGATVAAPALADPPQGHPHGQPPGQGDQQPPAAPPEHAAADPERHDPAPPSPGPSTSGSAEADPPAAQPTPPAAQPLDQGPATAQGEEAPGNTGTVKVHEVGTPDDDRRNEPKVCDFRIVGFGFPADADLDITILGHGGPNAGPSTFEADVTADQLSPAGDWAIPGPLLEDGMYKLEVENTTAPGGPKQKVFKVDCAAGDVSDDDVTGDDDVLDDDVTGDDDVLDDEVTGGDDVVDDDRAGETRVLGAYLEREPAQVRGTDAASGAGTLPRTGVELLTLAGGAVALMAGGTLIQRGARSAR